MKREEKKYVFPDAVGSAEIKGIRRMLSMTQREFAAFARVSAKTIERWESGGGEITGPIVPLIRILREDLSLPERFLIPERKLPVRLWYLFRRDVCTLIDVDQRTRRVEIYNYTEDVRFRAFGVIERPTWDQYEAFLESRCFPRTRDKLKLELERLNLPFYDPFLIIEKTGGRMAEDEFWLRVER